MRGLQVLDADTLFPLVLWVVIHAQLQHTGPHYLLGHLDRFARSQNPMAAAAAEEADTGAGNQHHQLRVWRGAFCAGCGV